MDIPPVRDRDLTGATQQAAAEFVRREVTALLPEPLRDGALPGQSGSRYPGRPTYVLGEKVWCWYGEATQKWWAFVPRESSMRQRGDRFVEALTPDQLRGEVARMLEGTAI